jgi:hypothetical protein
MKKKINRRVRGDRRDFCFERQKKHKSLYRNGLFFAFRSSGDQDNRMNEEKAESAEVVPGKLLCRFALPARMEKRAAFPPASQA